MGLSFLFIFNPNINIIDFLPDFIGYVLLCVALTPLGDINESIAEACESFKKMIFIDAAKLLALMWVFGLSVSSEYNSSLMLWSFVFGVLELIFLVPAYCKLFKGLSELGFFYENTSIIMAKGTQKKNRTDKLRNFTLIFIALKSVMSFLPELSDLTSTEYYENSGMTNLYQFIDVMRLMAFVPVLVVGIVWLIRIIFYFKGIANDSIFVDKINEIYEERICPKKGIFIKRNIALSMTVLIAAFVLSFDFRIENVNIIPDFLCAVLIFAFFMIISKKTPINKKLFIPLSVAYFISSIAASFFEFSFFKDYYYGAVYRDTGAYRAYYSWVAAVIISVVIFFAMCVVIIKTLSSVIDIHTGYTTVQQSENYEMQAKIAEGTKKELKKTLIFCFAASAAYAVGDICYVFLAKDYGFMLLVSFICAAVFVGSFIKAYFDIYEGVSTKYMLE